MPSCWWDLEVKNKLYMTTINKKLLILTCFVLVVGLLGFGVYNFTKKDKVTETSIQDQVFTEVTNSFQKSVEQTGTKDELSITDNLTKEQQKALGLPVEEVESGGGEGVQIGDIAYTGVDNGFELYNRDVSKIIVNIPRSPVIPDKDIVSKWDNNVTITRVEEQNDTEYDFIPLLKNPESDHFDYLTFLNNGDLHLYLGNNISNVFQFKIGGVEYWVSFITTQTGYENMYLSGVNFQNLTLIRGIYANSSNAYKNGNNLIMYEDYEGGLGSETVSYKKKLNIEQLIKAPTDSDYSKLLQDEK
jgi:hypothetical protein